MMRKRVLLGVLIVGVACGVLIGRFAWGGKVHAAKSPSDSMTLVAYPKGLYLRPDAGDSIHWVQAGPNGGPAFAHFKGGTPCMEGNDTATCTITGSAKGTYSYKCTDSVIPGDKNATKLCSDPGIDPNSSTDGILNKEATSPPKVSGAPSSPPPPDLHFQMTCEKGAILIYSDASDTPLQPSDISNVSSAIQWDFNKFTANVSIDPVLCNIQPVKNALYCALSSPTKQTYQMTVMDTGGSGCKSATTKIKVN